MPTPTALLVRCCCRITATAYSSAAYGSGRWATSELVEAKIGALRIGLRVRANEVRYHDPLTGADLETYDEAVDGRVAGERGRAAEKKQSGPGRARVWCASRCA